MKIIVITDWSVHDCFERVRAAAAVSDEVAIQHRNHGVAREVFVEQARRLREVCPRLFINSDVELAKKLGAGLHLPEHLSDVDFEGEVTLAVHQATQRRASAYLVSPVFTPNSKPADRPALGAARFHEIANTLPGPAFALGGITVDRIAELKPLAGIAVIGAVLHAPDAARATEALLRALD